MPAAVVFDLDGVLIDSEQLWARARHELVLEAGGTWNDDATRVMQGMSSVEWSRYLHDELCVGLAPAAISSAVVERMEKLYRARLPLLPGAGEAVASLAARWPLGLARAQRHVDIAAPCRSGVGVEREVAEGEELRRRIAAAQECADTREQLLRRERLDQIVVGTGVEPGDTIGDGVARRQHQDR